MGCAYVISVRPSGPPFLAITVTKVIPTTAMPQPLLSCRKRMVTKVKRTGVGQLKRFDMGWPVSTCLLVQDRQREPPVMKSTVALFSVDSRKSMYYSFFVRQCRGSSSHPKTRWVLFPLCWHVQADRYMFCYKPVLINTKDGNTVISGKTKQMLPNSLLAFFGSAYLS